MQHDTALVIGAGAFGTSIGFVLSNKFKNVILKVRSQDIYDCLKKGENTVYLPGQQLPSNFIPALTWEEVEQIQGKGKIELIVSGLPTAAIKPFYKENFTRIENYLKQQIPIVSLSKGIDSETLELPDDLFYDYFGVYRDLITFLSGPSFAKEILDEQITLVSLAGRSRSQLMNIAQMLQTDYFKAFPTYDIKGLLLGGALKNVVAIAGGIIEGLGYNHNTRAAVITRGIVEMMRFGKVFNARPETFYNLSGMGDLILTTTGGLSRNKMFGLEIAKGRKAQEIIDSQRYVVEGYKTTKAAYLLAQKYEIRTRIFEGLYRVLYEDVDPTKVIKELMMLPSKFEGE
jgi:glycerol-3-phosphate dehydrogenase (NAD(P)+)